MHTMKSRRELAIEKVEHTVSGGRRLRKVCVAATLGTAVYLGWEPTEYVLDSPVIELAALGTAAAAMVTVPVSRRRTTPSVNRVVYEYENQELLPHYEDGERKYDLGYVEGYSPTQHLKDRLADISGLAAYSGGFALGTAIFAEQSGATGEGLAMAALSSAFLMLTKKATTIALTALKILVC